MFKYIGDDRDVVEKVLVGNTVKYTSPVDFNDPFDSKPHLAKTDVHIFSLALEEAVDIKYQQQIKFGGRVDLLQPSFKNKSFAYNWARELNEDHINWSNNFRDSINKYGVFCLSRKRDITLQWSHYGLHHKGICFEFDLSDEDTFGQSAEVNYSKDYPEIQLMNFIKIRLHHDLNGLVYGDELKDLLDEIHYKTFLVKDIGWKYEEEVRFIRKQHGVIKFNPKYLKGVIFGAKCKQEFIDYVQKLIECHVPHVYQEKLKLHNNKYELVRDWYIPPKSS
ncbi:DUF2971 domain-containing protein [Vibrio alginolyticus]